MIRIGTIGLLAVFLAGCSLFGKPADTIEFNRGQFAVVAIRLAELHGTLTTLGTQACSSPKPPAELCTALSRAESRYQDLRPQVEKAITDPRTVPDWAAITRGLELLTGTVALVAPMFGLPGLAPLLGAPK